MSLNTVKSDTKSNGALAALVSLNKYFDLDKKYYLGDAGAFAGRFIQWEDTHRYVIWYWTPFPGVILYDFTYHEHSQKTYETARNVGIYLLGAASSYIIGHSVLSSFNSLGFAGYRGGSIDGVYKKLPTIDDYFRNPA